MKVMDIIRPRGKTPLDSDFIAPPIGFGSKAIEVTYIGKVDCQGEGRRICESNGKHNWFNHAQDRMRPSYPPEVYEDIY